MSKVAIIGAGNVGGFAAAWIAGLDVADVVLIDKNDGLARGKAMDINDSLYILGSNRWVWGGSDYSLIDGADIVVITAGVARKPGMDREDLLKINKEIVKDIIEKAKGLVADDAAWVFVTNPLDAITEFGYSLLGIDRHKVMGMGVNLDTSRMVNQIAESLGVARTSISAMVVGKHGKGMIPLVDDISVSGMAVSLDEEIKGEIRERTVNRGAEIVACFGTGSAYVAPGAGIYQVVRHLLSGDGSVLPLSVPLEGERGISGECTGVPVVLGRLCWEKVLE